MDGVPPDGAVPGCGSQRRSGVRATALCADIPKRAHMPSRERRFLRLDDEFAVFPFVAIRGAPVDGFAQFGAGQDGGIDALGDFLPFPLGEDAQQMEEHPSTGGAGVDGFAQGNEVGVVLVEIVRKVFKFAAVAGKAGELGEDEARDVAALDVLHHSLGLRVLHDGFATLAGEVIDFFYVPAPRSWHSSGAFLMMFGAVAFGLIFGRNANPDADWFFQGAIVLHSTIFIPRISNDYKKKVYLN